MKMRWVPGVVRECMRYSGRKRKVIRVISKSLCKMGGNLGFERWRSVVGLAPGKPNLSWTAVGRVVA